jgi:hypothetical protein
MHNDAMMYAIRYIYYGAVSWFIILLHHDRHANNMLIGPLQIIFALTSLYLTLGWSAFTGVAVMILSIPANAKIAGYLRRLQVQQMKNKDQRVKLMVSISNM